MITTQPQVQPTALYESKAAADALGISRACLATYARNGVIPFRIRKANGRRVYKGSDIIGLWLYKY